MLILGDPALTESDPRRWSALESAVSVGTRWSGAGAAAAKDEGVDDPSEGPRDRVAKVLMGDEWPEDTPTGLSPGAGRITAGDDEEDPPNTPLSLARLRPPLEDRAAPP